MKKGLFIIAAVGLVLLSAAVSAEMLRRQNVRKQWPEKQLENATKLGVALSSHLQKYGRYPERLADLVKPDLFNETEFEALRFKPSSTAKGEDWTYHAPSTTSDIAIISPRLVFPWDGHAGLYVTARADRGGELISNAKRDLLPTSSSR